ncbi:MAG TPA: methyltransferase domain-containing protein [bacterium]|nr:methyltransferase domain-containing protein [bacterium]
MLPSNNEDASLRMVTMNPWSRPTVGAKIHRMTEREYVLGTGADELSRLALQNRLWSDTAVRAWRAAGVAIGHRVLDVGCGPGYASFDLSNLVTPRGYVVGVDESRTFVDEANAMAAARGIEQFEARRGDVQRLGDALAGEAPFDIAYARWVLCFVADPGAVVRGIAEALRPGGRLVVHDYFAYASMTMAPRRRSHDLAVEATVRAWRKNGGDPDVGQHLPRLFAEFGLRLDAVRTHVRVARGNDSMFAWPDTWWRTFAPKLVAMGELEQTTCNELLRDLEAVAAGDGFVQCPPVYEFLATKI